MTAVDLITGGCGFIGRHLAQSIRATGRAVRILDCGEPRGLPAGVDYRRGSILDDAAVSAALIGIERVYHLAGDAHLWAADRGALARVNAQGTARLLNAAPPTARIVHCSSEAILFTGARDDARVHDGDPPPLDRMAGPYTRSKCLAERAAFAAARAGRDVVIASPTVPIGPDDWNMTPPAAMLALFLGGRSPFFLDCTLNLVDVRDVAEGLRLVGEKGRPGQRYVLGGQPVRLRQLLARLERMTGRSMPSVALPGCLAMAVAIVAEWISDHLSHRSPVAVREGVRLALRSTPLDDSKARRELGYAPGPIDEALALAVAWLSERSVPCADVSASACSTGI